jgi:hypothetical protein
MKIKALKQFPISPDGIKVQMLVPGETLEVAAELGQALVKAGLVEEVPPVKFYYAKLLDDDSKPASVCVPASDSPIEKRLREAMRETVEATRNAVKAEADKDANAASEHNKALLGAGKRPAVEGKAAEAEDDNPFLQGEADEAAETLAEALDEAAEDQKSAKPKPAPRARRENKDAGSRSRRS